MSSASSRRHLRANAFAAVIFDCDGTLVDSERLAIEVIVEMATEHGAALDLEQSLREFRGTRMADCVVRIEAVRGSPVPQEFVANTRRRMEERFRRDLKAIPGAHELLSGLAQPLAVASNGPREKMELTLGVTGLLPYFEGRLYSAYEVGHWKPKPELFLHAATELGVPPTECAVIEDSVPGIEGALAAGMSVFALANEHLDFARHPHLTKRVTVVQSLDELRGRL